MRGLFEMGWLILAVVLVVGIACTLVAWHAFAHLIGVIMEACNPD